MVEGIKLYKETMFKDTEIGRIPKEWAIARLKDIANILSGNTSPQENKYFKNGKYPFIRVKHLNSLQRQKYPAEYDLINDLAVSELKLKKFKKGSIIFPKSGESIRLEKRAILEEESFVVNHLAVIEPKNENVNNLFLFYYLCTIQTSNYLTATTMPSLNLSTIQRFLIPLPPLPEQKQIASILSTIDDAIQKTDEVIAKIECLKRGMMHQLLTRGIGHKEFKDTEIGRIPKEWEVVKLGEVVEIQDSKRIPLSETERINRRGPYPYCGANGVIDHVDDYIFDGESVLLAEDGGSYGKFENKAYIINGRFWVNNHAHVLLAVQEITSNWFMLYILNFLDLTSYIVGTTRKKLNQEQMREIRIPLPPLPEQQQIASILSTIDEKLELMAKEKIKLERLKQGFMKELLTGRIRVKVAS